MCLCSSCSPMWTRLAVMKSVEKLQRLRHQGEMTGGGGQPLLFHRPRKKMLWQRRGIWFLKTKKTTATTKIFENGFWEKWSERSERWLRRPAATVVRRLCSSFILWLSCCRAGQLTKGAHLRAAPGGPVQATDTYKTTRHGKNMSWRRDGGTTKGLKRLNYWNVLLL